MAFYEQIDDLWFFATEASCARVEQVLAVMLHTGHTWDELAEQLENARSEIRTEIVEQFGIDLDSPCEDEDVDDLMHESFNSWTNDRECWPGSPANLDDAGVPLEAFSTSTVWLSAPGMSGWINGLSLDDQQLHDVLGRLDDLGYTCTRTQGRIRSPSSRQGRGQPRARPRGARFEVRVRLPLPASPQSLADAIQRAPDSVWFISEQPGAACS